MTSKIALITVISTVLSAGGLMAKQDAPWRAGQGVRRNFMDRMSTALNLTDQQKQEAKTIFTSERAAARPDRQQLMQDRKAVESAIQAGKPLADVQRLAKSEGTIMGELAAKRATASAKFYAMLTPAQQQKLVGLHQEWRQRRRGAGSRTAAGAGTAQNR